PPPRRRRGRPAPRRVAAPAGDRPSRRRARARASPARRALARRRPSHTAEDDDGRRTSVGVVVGMNLAERIVALDEALADVPHAFGGALALAYYAEPRATVDIDLNLFVPATDYDDVA